MSKEADKASSGTAAPVVPGVNQVKCKASASLLPNNLTIGDRHLAYIHRNEIHLIENRSGVLSAEKAESLKSAYAEKDPISQIQFAKLTAFGGAEILIAITMQGLIHIWDAIGAKLLHSHKLQKSQVALSSRDAHLRGISHDGRETVYIGSGSGEILLFTTTPKAFTLTKKIEASKESIWDLTYKENILAVIDETGTLITFNVNGAGTELTKNIHTTPSISTSHLPATSVAIGHNLIVVADVTGELRIYSLTTRLLLVRIAAAARAINAIDFHPTLPLLLVAAEDTFISGWNLSSVSSAAASGSVVNGAVKNVLMLSPTPSLLTGVRFTGEGSKTVVATVYDSRFLSVLAAPTL